MLISHEELFVCTIKDLRSKIKSNKPYSLIRACGLCRHLLLDENPLIHQVNKKYKLPITFHIRDLKDAPLSHTYIGHGGRTILPIGDTKIVKLPEFLKTKVLHYGKHEFTVLEMIQTASHYFGGIHTVNPDLKQKTMSTLERYFKAENKTSFWMISVICKVILNAMKPLEAVIKKNISTGGFPPQY